MVDVCSIGALNLAFVVSTNAPNNSLIVLCAKAKKNMRCDILTKMYFEFDALLRVRPTFLRDASGISVNC